jgi:hypothetical protein
MADEKNKSVVVCGGGLNRKGYRILTEGIQLEAFKNNPIMLYIHARDDQWTAQYKGQDREKLHLPIGRWENIRMEDGQLLADPIFDVEDVFAKEIARKWDKGFLNACSMGFNFIEWSEDPIYLLQGQTRATVTKSELLEISIVDIPGDSDAVRLTLSDNPDPLSILPLITQKEVKKTDNMELKNIALTLGLSATATEAEVNAKIAALQNSQVEGVLALGRQKGIVTDINEAVMRTQVGQNPEFARLSWSQLPDPKSDTTPPPAPTTPIQGTLTAALREITQSNPTLVADDRKSWTLKDWRSKDPQGFLSLETANPSEFTRIVKSGIELGGAVGDEGMRFV